MSETTLPDHWLDVCRDLDLDPRPTDPPEGAAPGGWHEIHARFGERGFLRLMAAAEPDCRVDIQFALSNLDAPESVLSAVAAEFEEILEAEVSAPGGEAPWRLSATLEELPSEETVYELCVRAMSLGDHVDNADDGPDWLLDRLDASPSDDERPTAADSTKKSDEATGDSGAPGPSSGVFESIGDGESGGDSDESSGDVAVEDFEIEWRDEEFVVSLHLDGPVPPSELEELGRGLAHALRARYDVNARPIPHEDLNADQTADTAGARCAVRVGAASILVDEETDLEATAERVETYLERLQRFGDLGMSLGEVLGLDRSDPRSDRPRRAGTERQPDRDSSSKPPASRDDDEDTADTDRSRRPGRSQGGRETDADATGGNSRERDGRTSGDRSRDRRSEQTAARDSSVSSDSGGAADGSESSGVVLGTGQVTESETSTAQPAPESPLSPGNYTDPRLMRDDATTKLVDVVLRHPGYAEQKMAHNLSILLDVDYPDALELVEKAPCVIAWGVGRERAKNFKRVIEKAGGKVVLVEPDSLE